MSGEFKYFFLTMGNYDMVAIYEAPDDAVAARFSLQIGMRGRTHTLKAFPEAAYREIISSRGLVGARCAHESPPTFQTWFCEKIFLGD